MVADSIANGKAIESGEHDIQDDQVVGALQGFLQPERAVLGGIDVVPMIYEEVQEPGENSRLIFNNEQS